MSVPTGLNVGGGWWMLWVVWVVVGSGGGGDMTVVGGEWGVCPRGSTPLTGRDGQRHVVEHLRDQWASSQQFSRFGGSCSLTHRGATVLRLSTPTAHQHCVQKQHIGRGVFICQKTTTFIRANSSPANISCWRCFRPGPPPHQHHHPSPPGPGPILQRSGTAGAQCSQERAR